VIQHLFTSKEVEVHHSRLKFYRDATMNTTAEIKAHISNQDVLLGVEEIQNHRKVARNKWELKVKWLGLEEVESSWEPFEKLRQDVPRLVSVYCQKSGDVAMQQMDQAL
jgi:hypothetical protein